ncbi:MAG: hypothetical protein GXO65_07265 [Euryarchaeota archaeon]|nr:hypothetical protein [Euryarchaeota archaeon]
MNARERDLLYDIVSRRGHLTRRELLKELQWEREKLDYYLDVLYWEGLVELKGRKQREVYAVRGEKVYETFIERHIDVPYLVYNVNKEKLDSLLAEMEAAREGGND